MQMKGAGGTVRKAQLLGKAKDMSASFTAEHPYLSTPSLHLLCFNPIELKS